MLSIEQLFDAFNRLRVLIVGDVMIDRYLRGQVSRISPEAPVPVLAWQESEDRLGGAANVALNIGALGATPYLFSIMGKDDNHRIFLELLKQARLDDRGIIASSERVSTVKTRVIAQNQHLLRVDKEDTHDLSQAEARELLLRIKKCLDQETIDVLIFQDYNKGVLSEEVIGAVIREANQRNIPTVVDPKFRNFWAYRGVSLFKPNLREIRDQLSFPVLPSLESLQAATQVIRDRLNNTITLITLSDKGLFVEQGNQRSLIPTLPRSIADVCGAGDTVVSAVALALALDLPVLEIGQLANLAGGQVCEKVGVVPVDKDQLKSEWLRFHGKTVSRLDGRRLDG